VSAQKLSGHFGHNFADKKLYRRCCLPRTGGYFALGRFGVLIPLLLFFNQLTL
jgi:hypothetical protein